MLYELVHISYYLSYVTFFNRMRSLLHAQICVKILTVIQYSNKIEHLTYQSTVP